MDCEVHGNVLYAVGGASEVIVASREAGGALDVRSTPVILHVIVAAEASEKIGSGEGSPPATARLERVLRLSAVLPPHTSYDFLDASLMHTLP